MFIRFSCVRLFAIPWTVVHQAPLSMGFSRQEYWSGLPCPPPGDLPHSGTELASPASPALQVDSLPTEQPGKPVFYDYSKPKVRVSGWCVNPMSGGESSWCRAQELERRTILSTPKLPVYNVGTGQENHNKWSLSERKVVGDTQRSLV